jgi:hypothetical protein
MATMKQYAETGRLDGNAKGVYKKGEEKRFEHKAGLGHPSAMRGGGGGGGSGGGDGDGVAKPSGAGASVAPTSLIVSALDHCLVLLRARSRAAGAGDVCWVHEQGNRAEAVAGAVAARIMHIPPVLSAMHKPTAAVCWSAASSVKLAARHTDSK